MIKIAVFSALLAVALADGPPPPYRPPPPPPAYGPKPVYGKPEAKLPPQPFQYQYGVKDDYSGAAFEKAESQDVNGNVEGSYRVALPDGRTQIVTYHSDHVNGYVADVSYEGTAVYPPEPKEGYGYHPAAKPRYAPHPPPPPPAYKPVPKPLYVPA
jgi:hypothetical protein